MVTEINDDGDLEMTDGNIFLTSVFFQVVLEAGDILVVNTNWWFHETKVFFLDMPRCFIQFSVWI